CGSGLTSLMSLQYISASLQAVLVSTYPLILAATALGEGGVPAVLGTVLALAGIVAVVGGDDPAAILSCGVDLRGVRLALLTVGLAVGTMLVLIGVWLTQASRYSLWRTRMPRPTAIKTRGQR